MANEQTARKGFLDSAGVGHLWDKIRERYDAKLDAVTAHDESMQVTNGNEINVRVSAKTGNAVRVVSTSGEEGVFVQETTIAEGDGNGQIKFNGNNINVHGLGSAAYAQSGDFDASGAASAVLGTDADQPSAATVYGVKGYASDAYAAMKSLTNNEIDAAIEAASDSGL